MRTRVILVFSRAASASRGRAGNGDGRHGGERLQETIFGFIVNPFLRSIRRLTRVEQSAVAEIP